MRLSHIGRVLAFAASVAAVASTAACSQADTVLLVVIEGSGARPIFQFHVDVSIGGEMRSFKLPDQAQSVILPASFTVRVPRDLDGPLKITISARDELGKEVANGSALFNDFNVGAQNEARISIHPVAVAVEGGT